MSLKNLSALAALVLASFAQTSYADPCLSCIGGDQCIPCGSCCGSLSCEGCQLCGPCGFCGPYCDLEGIDVDSLTPEAQSKVLYDAHQARLQFEVPDDAHIYLNGAMMSTLGTERSFLVSVQSQDKDYNYGFKIDVVRGGKLYYKKKVEVIRAGAILKVVVVAPPVEPGEPGVIECAVEPVAVGGKPQADAAATEVGGEI